MFQQPGGWGRPEPHYPFFVPFEYDSAPSTD